MNSTLRDWLIVAFLAVIVGLFALHESRGPAPSPAPAPGPPPVVKPDAEPEARPEAPRPEDTKLSQAGRAYVRNVGVTLPDAWAKLADMIDDGKIDTKKAAVDQHRKLSQSAEVNAALDEVFSPGIDKDGKIVDPGKISTQLRQSAKALGRAR